MDARHLGLDLHFPQAFLTYAAIESANARIRMAVRARGHFPNEQAAMKCVCMALMGAVTLLGVCVPDGASGRGGVGFRSANVTVPIGGRIARSTAHCRRAPAGVSSTFCIWSHPIAHLHDQGIATTD